MTVDDTISEFQLLYEEIFCHQRFGTFRGTLRKKYDHRRLERAIQDLVVRRQPFDESPLRSTRLNSGGAECKT